MVSWKSQYTYTVHSTRHLVQCVLVPAASMPMFFGTHVQLLYCKSNFENWGIRNGMHSVEFPPLSCVYSHPSASLLICYVRCWAILDKKRSWSMISSPNLNRLGYCGLVILCWALNDTTSLQSLNLDLLNKMATLLAQNKTLKRLELRSDGLTQYKDAKLFTQHLVLGAARSTTLTGVCIGFTSWWRECHILGECAFLFLIITV